MHSAGQIREKLFDRSLDLQRVEEVAHVRDQLPPVNAVPLLAHDPVWLGLQDRLFQSQAAPMTDGFIAPKSRSIFDERAPIEAPSAFSDVIPDDSPNMSVVFEPNFADFSPVEEPVLEEPTTIGDEDEMRPMMQAMDWLSDNTWTLVTIGVGILVLKEGAKALGQHLHYRAEQREYDRRKYLRTLLLDGPHAFTLDEMRPALHDLRRDGRVEANLENITILTNSAAYQNPRDPEHAEAVTATLRARLNGLQEGLINPDIHRPAAAKELSELKQLITTPEFESSFFSYGPLEREFQNIGITPTEVATFESSIDKLRAKAAQQATQPTPARATDQEKPE